MRTRFFKAEVARIWHRGYTMGVDPPLVDTCMQIILLDDTPRLLVQWVLFGLMCLVYVKTTRVAMMYAVACGWRLCSTSTSTSTHGVEAFGAGPWDFH